MAYFDTTWYCNAGDQSTTGYYAVAKRASGAAVAAGQLVRQFTAPAVGSERVFVCRTAGTTAVATDATWVTTRGSITNDGTAVFQECTGVAAMNGDVVNTLTWDQVKAQGGVMSLGAIIKRNNGVSYQIATSAGTVGTTEPAFSDVAGTLTADGGTNWRSLGPVGNFTGGGAPHARLANALTGGAGNWFASGNTVYVGNNHAEVLTTSSINIIINSPLLARILCHNRLGSYPPAAGDLTTGATVTTTGSNDLSIGYTGSTGSAYFYGLTFSAGTGTTFTLKIATGATAPCWYYFDNCSLQVGSPGVCALTIGNAALATFVSVILNNTTVKFAAATHYIWLQNAQLTWRNTGQILAAGSAVPTTLFNQSTTGSNFNTVTLEALDLSQLTGSLFTTSSSSLGPVLVKDCKLNSATTVTAPTYTGVTVQLTNSASDVTPLYESSRYTYEAIESTETVVVRTGGYKDSLGQAQSRRIATTANAQWLRPYQAQSLSMWNYTIGYPVTITVCGTTNAASLPLNDEIWLEVNYLGSNLSPIGSVATSGKNKVWDSGSAVTSDSSTWAASTFTPASLTGLIGWWDFSVTSSVTLSGANVTRLADQSGAGNHVGDGIVTASRPQYEATGLNGRPTAAFGSSRFLPCNPFPMGTGSTITVFAVATLQACQYGRMVSYTHLGAAHDYDTAGSFTMCSGPTQPQMLITRSNVNTAVGLNSYEPAIHRMIFTISPTGATTTYIDGVATTGSALPGNWITGGHLRLGLAALDGFSFAGRISEAGVATGFSDAVTVSQLDTYLAMKWGLISSTYTPFKLTTTFTPNMPGYLISQVKVGKASSTYYIDPLTTSSITSPVIPANSVLPVISGMFIVGATLSTGNGTWIGDAPFTYTYQWKKGGVNISGATSSSYLLVSGDASGMITVTVTASNIAGVVSATSTAVGPVIAFGPPTLTGLIGWWDASVTASLNLTGSNINSIADQSGGGSTMNWAGYAKPVYNATGFDGTKPGIILNAIALGNAFEVVSFPMGTGNTLTWFYVGSNDYANASTDGRCLCYTGAGQTADWNNANSWLVHRSSSSTSAFTFGRNTSAHAPTSFVCSGSPNYHRVIGTIDSSGVMKVYVDGVGVTATNNSPGNWTSPGKLEWGKNAGANAFWGGTFGEMGVATGFSDATAAGQLDTYLKNKWGL